MNNFGLTMELTNWQFDNEDNSGSLTVSLPKKRRKPCEGLIFFVKFPILLLSTI